MNISLTNYRIPNSFGLECYATRAKKIDSIEALQQAETEAERESLPLLVLGGGSNLLLVEPRMQVYCAQMLMRGIEYRQLDEQNCHAVVAAGENWHGFVSQSLQAAWQGLENLSLIPGTVGAAPIQNIGAYGVESGERILAVDYYDLELSRVCRLATEECRFAYRDSVFKRELKDRAIVLGVTFKLQRNGELNVSYDALSREMAHIPREEWTAQRVAQTVISIRRSRLPDPEQLGNAGSFFKNPVVTRELADMLRDCHPEMPLYSQPDGTCKLAAGWLIDKSGMKGWRRGAAATHDRQALVLVNHGGASGKDLLALAREIRDRVAAEFNVVLENEVRILDAYAQEILL